MATDVFSRDVSYGGAFSADGAAVTFTNFGAGLLVQNISYVYQQAITRLYEVGSSDIYLVAGRTQGQVTLARVLGPSVLMPAFYTQYGNVCNAAGNSLTFTAQMGCGSQGGGQVQTVGINHAVISQLGGSVSAQDMVINETLAMMFLYMTVS
jgi:hypothetical protein